MVSASPSGQGYLVAVEGIDTAKFDPNLEERLRALASRAINATARRMRTQASRLIREQIAFPARYLDSRTDGNLRITENAKADSLEAVIRGRFRPTSLTRFVKGPLRHGRKAPTVEVSPGRRERMNRAFLLNLRSGNVGLAVRLKPGERVENKQFMVSVSNGLYLLYGPSVNQVFEQVAEDVEDDAGAFLEQEFLRLTEALL